MRIMWTVGLVALLLPLPASGTGAQESAPWWPPGQTGMAEGFHMRIPITVTNDLGYPISNGAVSAGLDIGAKLAAAGWPKSPSGGRDLLKGFHLDLDSIRVVAMTESWQLKATNPTFTDPKDARRYEVPSSHFEAPENDDYTSPNRTILWRVPGTVEHGARANFMVYFDNDRTSAKKAPPTKDASIPQADLESLFWSGPGVTLYGFIRPPSGQAGTVEVLGTQPGTRVQVFTGALTSNSQFQPFRAEALPEGGNTFTIGAQESRTIKVSSGVPVAVKLVANRPIVAEGTSSGFVPSLDGGLSGKSFLFALRHPLAREQDTVYFTKTGPGETVVRVDRLDKADASFPRTFTLPNGPPYVYSTGWRASMTQEGASCSANHQQGLPAGTYKATVTKGERVLVQLQPADGLVQVPTLQGAPAGTEFWAATDWNDDQFAGGGDCRVVTRAGQWFATATGQTALMAVTNPESPIQLDPRGDLKTVAYPPPRAIEGGPFLAGPYRAGMADRPVQFTASEPVRLFAGLYPAQTGTQGANYPLSFPTFGSTGVPVINGPLGGSASGRDFAGAGASVVIAPFDDTVLRVVDITRLRSDERLQGVAMSADSSFVIQDAQSDLVKSFTVKSTLPVVVYPLAASAGFFASVPAFLPAAAGPAQFRGFLVGLSSPTGMDPVVASGTPGVPVSYPLQVTNFGRATDGGNLPDNIQLSVDVAGLAPGWQADLDVKGSVSLGSGQSKPFFLTVRAPEGALPGQTAIAVVRATSIGNPLVQDTLQSVTFLKQSFGVGLWFGQEGGPRQSIGHIEGGVARFDLVAKNTGSVRDTLRLQADLNENGWTATVLRDGLPVQDIALEPGESVRLVLKVESPATGVGAAQGLADVTVTATSRSAPSMQDVVRATAELVPPSDLKLVAKDTVRFVAPGEIARFNLTLGDSSGTQILTAVQAGQQDGWGAPRILKGNAPLPSKASLPTPTEIHVDVKAPDNGTAGSSITLRFSARSERGGHSLDVILFARVRTVHTLEVIPPALPLDIKALGQNTSVDLRVTNLGNLDEVLTLSPVDLPTGWSLGLPQEVLVARGATQTVRLDIRAPIGTPPGSYPIALRLVAQDGNETIVSLPALVGIVAGQSVTDHPAKAVQPGERVRVEVPVSNEGNTPLRLNITRQAGESWTLLAGPDVQLRPGERAALVLYWIVSTDAADGSSTHTAVLRLTPEGTAEARTELVASTFEVGRANLRITNATSMAAPGGTLVRATVENHGNRPARDFVVDLVVDGLVIDQARIGDLPVGGTARLSFLQVGAGTATLVADGNHSVSELDEGDNEVVVVSSPTRPAPAAGLGFIFVLAALAVVRRRQGGR